MSEAEGQRRERLADLAAQVLGHLDVAERGLDHFVSCTALDGLQRDARQRQPSDPVLSQPRSGEGVAGRSRLPASTSTVRSVPAPLHFLVLLLGSWIASQQGEAIEYLRAENRVLRARLQRKRLRFTDGERRLLAEKGKPLGRKRLAEVASLATPETILRWYREQIAAKYDGSRARAASGPTLGRRDKVQLLLTMARENPSWGYTRLHGALKNVGFDLGRSTIQRILKANGIEPAPVRGRTLPWAAFLRAHWGAIAASDFFSVEVLTRGGFVRYLVLFVIELKTRRVHIAGVTCRADGAWMTQIARNLTDATIGPLAGFTHLLADRDPLYTAQFQTALRAAGIQLVRLPVNSPNLNAYAERFVRSVRQECLRHIIPLSERRLRRVLREYVDHYHAERNHQGLGNVIPFPSPASPRTGRTISRRQRLGGILNFYACAAA
jgi:putative transposase